MKLQVCSKKISEIHTCGNVRDKGFSVRGPLMRTDKEKVK